VGYAQPVSTRLTARTALLGAAGATALLVVTWFAAFHVGVVRHADRSILRGFFELGHGNTIRPLASFIAQLCNPNPYVFFAAVPVLIALLRRRFRLALAICVILLGANVTTQLLKPLLAQPRGAVSVLGGFSPVAAASWPSGHATAAMSLALCCVLAVPSWLRPSVAALGAAFAAAVCYSFLALGWHYPSDVLGGFLVATTWALLGVSALLAMQRHRVVSTSTGPRSPVREALGPPAAAMLGAIVLAAVVAIARPHQVVGYVGAHEVFVIGAPLIAVVALALATGVMLAVRR
jgi:membrane-associated phospholipid phosphatase